MIRSKTVRDNTNEIAKIDEPKSNDSLMNNFSLGNLAKNVINYTKNSNPIQAISNIFSNLTTSNDEKFFDKIRKFDAEDFYEELNNTFSNYLPLGYKFDLPSEANVIKLS